MSRSVLALGLFVIVTSVWVLLFPDQVVSLANWETKQGLYLAAGIRVVMGLILVVAAPSTRYPTGLRLFGAVVLLAGLVLPFVPLDLWASLMEWWLVDNRTGYRIGGGLGGLLIGSFLVHAARSDQSGSPIPSDSA